MLSPPARHGLPGRHKWNAHAVFRRELAVFPRAIVDPGRPVSLQVKVSADGLAQAPLGRARQVFPTEDSPLATEESK